MVAKLMRRLLIVAALGLSASFAARANAQCCGTGYSAYYQPAAYTAYSPVAYTSYYGGWYPGYWLDRIRARVWGSPTTYVAAYPSTYATSYAPSYAVGYRPAYSVGYATSYAAPAATYSGCATCTAAYSPCSTCTTAYAPCSGCATCAAPAVGQAVYQQPAGCASCGTAAAVVAPGTVVVPPPPAAAPQQGAAGATDSRPELAPSEQVGPRTYRERPANGTQQNGTEQNGTQQNGTQQEIQPEPANDTNGKDPYDVKGDSSTYFQAPKLFDPNDRTAQRSHAGGTRPVTTALYEKPVSYRNVVAQRITAEKAALDAAGWVSTSK